MLLYLLFYLSKKKNLVVFPLKSIESANYEEGIWH